MAKISFPYLSCKILYLQFAINTRLKSYSVVYLCCKIQIIYSLENCKIINFNRETMKKLLVIRSFGIASILLVFIILSYLLIIWCIRVNFSDSYEISPYAYINLGAMTIGAVLYVSRNLMGWTIIVILMTINTLAVVYKVIVMYGETEGLSLIVLPYALFCVGIVYLSTLSSLTKHFFSSEEQKQKTLVTCALTIKIFILSYYFNSIH